MNLESAGDDFTQNGDTSAACFGVGVFVEIFHVWCGVHIRELFQNTQRNDVTIRLRSNTPISNCFWGVGRAAIGEMETNVACDMSPSEQKGPDPEGCGCCN